MNTEKVWFVTGASKGVGLALVKKLVQKGCKVAATSRSVDGFDADLRNADNFLPLEVHLNEENSVKTAVEKAVATFGKIDVVVNNAGYAQLGTLEELSDAETRENFNVNVFGTLNVIRQVMPHLRAQHSGHIINISSIAGFNGMYAGVGIYCATKFAVAGLTEALAREVKELGVAATVVYPGTIRTNFLEKNVVGIPKNPIAEYTEGRKMVALHTDVLNGEQQGNPEKVADALITLSEMAQPPLHLFLGTDANQLAESKIDYLKKDLAAHQDLTQSTDF